jgi:membrane fusion protein, multidrug efflux system
MDVVDLRPGPVLRSIALTLLGLALVLPPTSCSSGPSTVADAQSAGHEGRGGASAAVPVDTAPVVVKTMPVDLQAVGNVEASSTVEVRSQVTGQLLSVGFSEGQDVAAGQLLFALDSRPFEAALKQAQAALAKDQAQAKNADAQRARNADLLKRGLVAQSDYDALVASAAALHAAADADEAQVDNAKLQLQYTRITAPVSGRTGALLVHQGALVRSNDTTPLVVINQLAPIYVSFSVPSRLLSEIRSERDRGPLAVEAVVSGSSNPSSHGAVSFIDNAADQTTDTVRLKATFANADRRLWPGQFVEVTLRLAVDPHAIVVPAVAVQPGQQGSFVFVVKPDNTVEQRPVTVLRIGGDEAVIGTGLQAGEIVVTDGQLRLTPGAHISVKNSGAKAESGR